MKAIALVLLLLAAGTAIAPSHYDVVDRARAGVEAAGDRAREAVQGVLPEMPPAERAISEGRAPLSNITRFRDTFSLQVVPGQSVVLTTFPPGSGVGAISLNVVPGSGQDTVTVTIDRRGGAASPVGIAPQGAVHSYVEITPNASTTGGTAQVKVDCAWLNALGVPDAATRLRVHHFGPAGWESLPTRVTPDPAGCVFVEFDTPSFSWFSVTVEPQTTVGGVPVPKPAPGFEAVFAVAGLLAAAYVVSRRKP